jgi:hypothetical protein
MGCLGYFIGQKRDFLNTPGKKAGMFNKKTPKKVFIIEHLPLTGISYPIEIS